MLCETVGDRNSALPYRPTTARGLPGACWVRLPKNRTHQDLPEALQIVGVLLKDIVNHVRINTIVEVDHTVTKCDHADIVISSRRINETRIAQGQNEVRAVFRRGEIQGSNYVSANIQESLDGGLQTVQRRIQVAHVGSEFRFGQPPQPLYLLLVGRDHVEFATDILGVHRARSLPALPTSVRAPSNGGR